MSATMTRLGAGDLRQKITLLEPTSVPDGSGGTTEGWSPIKTVRAEVLGINGREAVIGEALRGISYYRIRIRFRTGITDKFQIRYGSIDLNVSSVSDPNGDSEQLLILADTGSARKTQ